MPNKIEALKYRAEEVHIVSMSMGDFESKAYIMMEKELVPAFEYGIKNVSGHIFVYTSSTVIKIDKLNPMAFFLKRAEEVKE